MQKSHVQLTTSDRNILVELNHKGSSLARTFKRVRALLALDEGNTYQATAKLAGLSHITLSKLAKRYANEGLTCLYDKPRGGRPIEISAAVSDQITCLALEDSPEGTSQWSLRLLAEKTVELGYCEHISHTQVGTILKKNQTSLS